MPTHIHNRSNIYVCTLIFIVFIEPKYKNMAHYTISFLLTIPPVC